MALPLRVIPLKGSEAERQAKAASIMVGEIHSTNDQERVFLKNRLVGPAWHGEVANQSAMLALNGTSARGCWPGDMCKRTDTGSKFLCIANNGTSAADWEDMGAVSSAPGASGHWEPVTNGSVSSPEIVFSAGDVVMTFVTD